MTGELTFSTSIINNSIVGGSTVTQDNTAPFSFLQFITNTGVDYSPEQYNKFYIYYLKEWSDIRNAKETTNIVNFQDIYVDFLKDITITYSTRQELKFLSTLDFNNPTDLDIAIPFYVDKIRQIILFYKEKRDTSKFIIERNKLKGTSYGIEKVLFDKIYDYVFSTQDKPGYTALSYSLSAIQAHLKIDIQEFVDVYSNYFDLPKDNGEFVRANVTNIDADLYFKDPLDIFRSAVFLNEIPLAVNVALSIDAICDPNNPILLAQNECTNMTGFTPEQTISLQKKLLSKYMGTDFHYINTTVSPIVSGILFVAENPNNNIQNLQAAHTPTVQTNEIKLLRDIGLFFKPDKTGIFQLNAKNFTYQIDTANLEQNKIYIFPDPKVYGNVTANNQQDYPLVFIYDNRPDVRNASSSFVAGDPYVTNLEPTFSPYYSREQSTLANQARDASYNLNFNDLFNKGYITKYQTDIYGNEYALFKDSFGQSFKSITEVDTQPILNLLLNGHLFYDPQEGYNFNYSIASTSGSTVRSGLSTTTISSIVSSKSFALTSSPLYLYFREYAPYQELNYIGGFDDTLGNVNNYIGAFRDCASFTFSNGEPFPDAISADIELWPGTGLYYYSELTDAGVSSLDPLARGLLSGYMLTEYSEVITTESSNEIYAAVDADFTLDVKLAFANPGVEDYNCGYFTDRVELANDYNYSKGYDYVDIVSDDSETVFSTLTGNDNYNIISYRDALEGRLYIKNQAYSLSEPISSALNVIFGKYTTDVQLEVASSVRDFEIFYNSIVVETDNYLVLDKINYEDGAFASPMTKNNVYSYASIDMSRFSNRFFNEYDNKLTFCVIQQVASLSSLNAKALYPKIYQYDVKTNATKTLFPKQSDIASLSSVFNLSAVFTDRFNVNIVSVEKPVLTYNSLNDVFKLTYIGIDNNNFFHIFDTEFDVIESGARILNTKFYKSDKNLLTTNFTKPETIFVSVNTISGTYITSSSTGILTI